MAGTTTRLLRYFARGWSVLSVLFVLAFAIGEGLTGTGPAPSATEWVGLAFFPIGVAIGLVLGWRREALGGSVAVASLAVFYVWAFLSRGRLPAGPFFVLVAAPGFIYLGCYLLQHYGGG